MVNLPPALLEQRIDEIKGQILTGSYRQELCDYCKKYTDMTPVEKDRLIDMAYAEIQEIKDRTDEENKDLVMIHLWKVFHRACAKQDLSAQVSSLSVLGKFCGLSEKNPYRGKVPKELQFTEDDYDRALQS